MIYCNYPGIISAGMVELADTMDLGSIGQPCRFKSCYPHHIKEQSLIQKQPSKSEGCFCIYARKA